MANRQPNADSKIIQTPNGSLMIVASHPPESIFCDPQQSYMCSVGIDAASQSLVGDDAASLASTMVDCGVVLEENVLVLTTPSDYDRCTKGGIHDAFVQQAEKVGRNGVFVFSFSGKGEPVGHQDRSLVGVDFNKDDPITHISAVTLLQWVSELSHKPKLMLFILDCSSAGSIASEIVASRNSESIDNLCVLSACGNAENPITLGTLGHSIFTYFVGWCFRAANAERPFSSGFIPLRKVFDSVTSCSMALSSLIVTYNPAQRELRPNAFNPTAVYLQKPTITMEMVQQMLNPATGGMGHDSPDGASVGRFEIINRHYDYAKKTRLHDRALSWFDSTMKALADDAFSCPLATLHANGALKEDKVLLTVVCSLVFSLTSIQVAHNKDSIKDPNTFILAFYHAVSAISFVDPEAEMVINPLEYARRALTCYQQVVSENGIKQKELREFSWKLNGEGMGVNSCGHK